MIGIVTPMPVDEIKNLYELFMKSDYWKKKMSEISKLIEPNNPALRVRLNEVTEKCDREKIAKDLTDSMEHYQGIGLSD